VRCIQEEQLARRVVKLRRKSLRVVYLKEGAFWVAQCLEYDIAAQGDSIPKAREAFYRQLIGEMIVDLSQGEALLLGRIPKPPEDYLESYKTGEFLSAEDLEGEEPVYHVQGVKGFPGKTPIEFPELRERKA